MRYPRPDRRTTHTRIFFGSATTGLGSSDSDLDLCLFDPTFPQGFPAGVDTRAPGTIYDMNEIANWLRTVPDVRVTETIENAKCRSSSSSRT